MYLDQRVKEIHSGIIRIYEEEYLKKLAVGDKEGKRGTDQGDQGKNDVYFFGFERFSLHGSAPSKQIVNYKEYCNCFYENMQRDFGHLTAKEICA